MRWAGWISLLLLGLAGQVAAQPTDLAGTWRGVWTKSADPLPVTMTFVRAGEGYAGVFDSDALQVSGIPVTAIATGEGKVHFEIKGDAATTIFDGEIDRNRMSGGFIDSPTTGGHFELSREGAAPAAAAMREVSFRSGDATLAGTLLLPARPGRRPAVIFLQGSGPEGRWANRYLAQKLAQAGVVALIYDKRGVGGSSGDWRGAGFETLADDAAAGVALLRSLPEVDPSRVGLYGHSQGATLAPLVAARAGGLGFIIAAAPAGIDQAEVEIYSLENSIGAGRLSGAERTEAETYVHAIVDVAYRGKDRRSLDALAARLKQRAWYFDPPPPGDAYWTISRKIAGYRPAAAWRRVKSPVLLLFGDDDERVPPGPSLDAIGAALHAAGNDRVLVKVYAGADHNFILTQPPNPGGWPKREPDYAVQLLNWISAQVGY